VVKEPLTTEMTAAGEELMQRLDAADFGVVAAFWLYALEPNRWRLMLASPLVDREGPIKAYARIQATLVKRPDAVPGLSVRNITVLSPKDPLVKKLRTVIRVGKGKRGMRFSSARVRDTFVEDSYIYRLL